MVFKKHNWFDYNRSVDTLEVTMKDWNGRVIDSLLPGWKTIVFDDENWVGKGTKIFFN
jgi:hypothetical protein